MATAGFTARQKLTLLATSIGLFMIFLDATIVNVALPDIQKDFNAAEQGLQWVDAADDAGSWRRIGAALARFPDR